MESSKFNPLVPILQEMTLEDITRARLERPYNLPTDKETFRSFEECYECILRRMLQLCFRRYNRQLRQDADESDTSTDESEEEGGLVTVDWEDKQEIAQFLIDIENKGSKGRNERLNLVQSMQFRELGRHGGLYCGVHRVYGRRSGGGVGGDAHLAEGLRRPFASMIGRTSEPHRTLEPGEIPDGVEDVDIDIEGVEAMENGLRVVNLVHPPALSPPSTPTRNPGKRRDLEESSLGWPASNSRDRVVMHESTWDCPHGARSHPEDGRDNASSSRETKDNAPSSKETRDNASRSKDTRDNATSLRGTSSSDPLQQQVGDFDSLESTVEGNREIIANVGLLLENSIKPTRIEGEEGMVWPKFERPIAFNPHVDENLYTKNRENTSNKKPKIERLTWADVYEKLPAKSGHEDQPPTNYWDKRTEFLRIKREEFRKFVLRSSHPNRGMRVSREGQAVRDTMRSLEITFVGENCSMNKFSPWRGDLIIALRNGRPRPTYLESYTKELGNKFSFGELVLRIGYFNKFSPILSPNDFEYNPYTRVELYAFNPMDTSPPTKWKFLGRQNELKGALFHPPYESPGKFLKVGSPLLDYNTEFEPLVPRRGDVIIKREAWKADYHHNMNFWYSMVKWHRGTKFHFVAGDMLVRRFIDNQYNEQKSLNIPSNPLLWGWAELYEYHHFHNWIFWGRTRHFHDAPLVIDDTISTNYTCDQGDASEDDVDFEIMNPRLDTF